MPTFEWPVVADIVRGIDRPHWKQSPLASHVSEPHSGHAGPSDGLTKFIEHLPRNHAGVRQADVELLNRLSFGQIQHLAASNGRFCP
jgi:hypothetical protein